MLLDGVVISIMVMAMEISHTFSHDEYTKDYSNQKKKNHVARKAQ